MEVNTDILLSCFELGYTSCEKGQNIEKAKLEFLKIMKVIKPK